GERRFPGCLAFSDYPATGSRTVAMALYEYRNLECNHDDTRVANPKPDPEFIPTVSHFPHLAACLHELLARSTPRHGRCTRPQPHTDCVDIQRLVEKPLHAIASDILLGIACPVLTIFGMMNRHI